MPINPPPETTVWQAGNGCDIQVRRAGPVAVTLSCELCAADLGQIREGNDGWDLDGTIAGLVIPPEDRSHIWAIIRAVADAHWNAVKGNSASAARQQVDNVMYHIAGRLYCHSPCCAECLSVCCAICIPTGGDCIGEAFLAKRTKGIHARDMICGCGCPECFCAACPALVNSGKRGIRQLVACAVRRLVP